MRDMSHERKGMLAGFKLIVWFLCISCAEVGLIIFLAHKLGSTLTFLLFAAPAVIGLLIQWVRWYRLKPMRDEMDRLLQNYKRLQQEDARLASDFFKSDEGGALSRLTMDNM